VETTPGTPKITPTPTALFPGMPTPCKGLGITHGAGEDDETESLGQLVNEDDTEGLPGLERSSGWDPGPSTAENPSIEATEVTTGQQTETAVHNFTSQEYVCYARDTVTMSINAVDYPSQVITFSPQVQGHPWVPVGSLVGPRFLAGIRGSPQKIRLLWVPVALW
jgi:hypothetical protein